MSQYKEIIVLFLPVMINNISSKLDLIIPSNWSLAGPTIDTDCSHKKPLWNSGGIRLDWINWKTQRFFCPHHQQETIFRDNSTAKKELWRVRIVCDCLIRLYCEFFPYYLNVDPLCAEIVAPESRVTNNSTILNSMCLFISRHQSVQCNSTRSMLLFAVMWHVVLIIMQLTLSTATDCYAQLCPVTQSHSYLL